LIGAGPEQGVYKSQLKMTVLVSALEQLFFQVLTTLQTYVQLILYHYDEDIARSAFLRMMPANGEII
jgi:hypothetical protein